MSEQPKEHQAEEIVTTGSFAKGGCPKAGVYLIDLADIRADAERVQRHFRDMPPHVKDRQTSRELDTLAAHCLALCDEVERLRAGLRAERGTER